MKINKGVKTECTRVLEGYCRALGIFDLEQAISFFSDNCSFIGNTTGLNIKRSRRKFLVTLMIGEKKVLEKHVLLSNKLIFS